MRRRTYATLFLTLTAFIAPCATSDAAVYAHVTFSERAVEAALGGSDFNLASAMTWNRTFTPTVGTISITTRRTDSSTSPATTATMGGLSVVSNSTAAADPGMISGNYFRMVLPAAHDTFTYTNFDIFTFASVATSDDIAITSKVSGSGLWEIRNNSGTMIARVTLDKDASNNMTVALGAGAPVATSVVSTGWADLLIQTNREDGTYSASLNGTPIGSSTFMASIGTGFGSLRLQPATGGRMYADELLVETAVIPEPAVGALAVLGLGAFAMRRRHAK